MAGWTYVDDWDDIERALVSEMQVATQRTAEVVFSQAQAAVPVDTGDLRDSGSVVKGSPDGSSVAITAIQYGEPYSVYVHDGYFNVRAGRFMAPRRWLTTPLMAAEGLLMTEAERAMERAFRRSKS